MSRRFIPVVLLVLIMSLLFSCAAPDGGDGNTTTGTPSSTTAATTAATTAGTTTTTGASNPAPVVFKLSSQYAAAGERASVTAEVTGSDSAWTFTFSDESMVTVRNTTDTKVTFIPKVAGNLTVTATNGTETFSDTLKIFPAESTVVLEDQNITYIGRVDHSMDGRVIINNTAAGFEIRFFGKELIADFTFTRASVFTVLVDGATDTEAKLITLGKSSTSGKYVLASFDQAGEHTVRILKRTEEQISDATLRGITIKSGGILSPLPKGDQLKIEAYGDSITAGYGNMRGPGVADNHSAEHQNGLGTYAALAAWELGADYRAHAESGVGLYTNPHGIPQCMKDMYGMVSPYSNLEHSDDWVPDVIVINMGTNDIGTRTANNGKPAYDAATFAEHYKQFVRDLSARYGNADIKFVLCSGLMDSNALAPILNNIKPVLEGEGFDITVVTFARTTANGHPLYAEHQAASELLVAAIREALA